MKIINSNNIIDNIRAALLRDCNNRSLDDGEDFEAVMATITSILDEWMANRCPGCR